MPKAKKEQFTKEEAQQRFDAMLKGALKTPPKPLKDVPKKRKESLGVDKKKPAR